MLSFMREQGLGEPSGQKPPPSLSCKSKKGGEYLTVAARDKNVRKSTILLAGLFILGLLGLWFMIKKSVPPAAASILQSKAAGEESQIEMAITRLIGVRSEIFNRLGEIVKKFYEFSDVQQVKVNELKKNPFKREIFLGNLKEKSDTEGRNFDIDADIMRQQQLRQQTKNMQLLSIMAMDTGSCCMIDDRILYEGDSIRGFNVRQIGDSTVSLESDGVEIILKLSE